MSFRWRVPKRLAKVGRNAPPFKEELKYWHEIVSMRVGMAAIVAVLTLNFVDEHFNDARYTRAAINVISQVARAFV